MPGPLPAILAGTLPRCCHTFARSRMRPVLPTLRAGITARSMSKPARTCRICPPRWSRQRRNAAWRTTRITTAVQSKASPIASVRCVAGCATARRGPICIRSACAPIWLSNAAHRQRGSALPDGGRSGSTFDKMVLPVMPRCAVRLSWRRARSGHRICSNCRASAMLRDCGGWGSRWWPICPASAKICRTISLPAASGRLPARSRSTSARGAGGC